MTPQVKWTAAWVLVLVVGIAAGVAALLTPVTASASACAENSYCTAYHPGYGVYGGPQPCANCPSGCKCPFPPPWQIVQSACPDGQFTSPGSCS